MGGGGRLSIEEGKHEHVSPEAPCVGQASESQGVQGVSVDRSTKIASGHLQPGPFICLLQTTYDGI